MKNFIKKKTALVLSACAALFCGHMMVAMTAHQFALKEDEAKRALKAMESAANPISFEEAKVQAQNAIGQLSSVPALQQSLKDQFDKTVLKAGTVPPPPPPPQPTPPQFAINTLLDKAAPLTAFETKILEDKLAELQARNQDKSLQTRIIGKLKGGPVPPPPPVDPFAKVRALLAKPLLTNVEKIALERELENPNLPGDLRANIQAKLVPPPPPPPPVNLDVNTLLTKTAPLTAFETKILEDKYEELKTNKKDPSTEARILAKLTGIKVPPPPGPFASINALLAKKELSTVEKTALERERNNPNVPADLQEKIRQKLIGLIQNTSGKWEKLEQ